jgi:hypothetical protein
MIHVSKSTFSIRNRTLSLRRLLKRFFWRARASALQLFPLKDPKNAQCPDFARQRCLDEFLWERACSR